MKTYLVIVRLKNDSNMERLAEVIPDLVNILNGISNSDMQQCFRSNDGILSGYYVNTNKNAHFIRIALEKSSKTQNGDHFLVNEIGRDYDGLGFSRAWAWLQHHIQTSP